MQSTTIGTEENSTSASSTSLSKGNEVQGPALPPLSSADFKLYNRMAEHMDLYHNHFRSTWTQMHKTCSAPPHTLPATAPSMPAFFALGTQLVRQLTMHHSIEEAHIFPVLAARMPAFRDTDLLLAQHREIHAGLDRLEAVLDTMRRRCGSTDKAAVDWAPLRECMASFGTVLWAHLDAEVAQLGAENMRRFWSREEMRRMPM